MIDDQTNPGTGSSTEASTGPSDQNRPRIDIGHAVDADEDAEARKWAEKLDTTPEQIRDAVAEVGDRADDVEMHLKGTRATTNADQAQRAEQVGSHTTLVGIFPDKWTSEQAMETMIRSGFTPSLTSVQADRPASGQAPAHPRGESLQQEGALTRFAHQIFGDDRNTPVEGKAASDEAPMQPGSHGLTVSAAGDADIRQATDIMKAAGAIEVTQRAELWRADGWEADTTESDSAMAPDSAARS